MTKTPMFLKPNEVKSLLGISPKMLRELKDTVLIKGVPLSGTTPIKTPKNRALNLKLNQCISDIYSFLLALSVKKNQIISFTINSIL